MKGDYSYFRFFAYVSLFIFFMTVLVLGHNFLLLYLGWEGVGLASYLLIGYYYPRPAAVAAAKKAFIVNRIGDIGFAIGIFAIYNAFGSLDYAAVLNTDAIQNALATHSSVMYIPFLLMLGAFGKSAQFPLHVWLPDAMEGPTPVSALIHAATMVTAGIYMIARCMPLFAINPAALLTVACVGTFTAFMAASIAFCQYDIKRIWAYSTLSQLGYMFLGLGVSASIPAVFHVVTHAFFKALLFLAAGSVMHAMGGELDIRKMSGLRKVLPITCWTMFIGCLALAGVPGLSGFFSKDEILSAAVNSPTALGQFLGYVGLLVALMTAYYTFRAWFRIFGGPLVLPATAGHHEPSPFALPTPRCEVKKYELK
jgi:NADH-quinone oxidoreductase subunit L